MSSDREQKIKIVEDTISSIEKTYGKGSIMKLGDGVIASSRIYTDRSIIS